MYNRILKNLLTQQMLVIKDLTKNVLNEEITSSQVFNQELLSRLIESIPQGHRDIIVDFLSGFNELLQEAMPKPPLDIQEKRIRKAKDYIWKNYKKSITEIEVAQHVGLSTSGLSHLFKNNGAGYLYYLNEVRIEHACRLLLETNDTVEGIGYCCGFVNSAHFNMVFKRHKGVTPGKFRKIKSEKLKIKNE